MKFKLKYRRLKHLSIASLSLLLAMVGCNIDDSRDECCTELIIDYRYTTGAKDMFRDKITHIRHYLFDVNGILIQQFDPKSEDMQRQVLELPQGEYSMLSIGNLDKTEKLDAEVNVSTLSNIMLQLDGLDNSDPKGNCSQIFYGYRTFDAIDNEKLHYVTDMSNIHCVLDITVRWKTIVPSHTTPYTFNLYSVAGEYSNILPEFLTKVADYTDTKAYYTASTFEKIVHSFPEVSTVTLVNHKQEVSAYNNQLHTRFVTFRYRDNQIPFLSITNNGKEILRKIDLTETFQRMGWVIDKNIEQKYAIIIEIAPNEIIIYPGEIDNADWVDGGIVS